MRKVPPAATVWTNEQQKKVMLYAKTEIANVFWIDNVGYIYDRPDVPDECKGRGVMQVYGFVLIEYEMGDDGPRLIAPEQQIELGDGDKLTFRYTMKVAQLNDAKVRAWKEHSKNFPLISHDFDVWNEKVGKSDRAHFSPVPHSLWQENPSVKRRIILEARKMYPNVKKNMAKDFTREEIIKMFPDIEKQLNLSGQGVNLKPSDQMEVDTEETDFSMLLGNPGGETSSSVETPPQQ
jgi:hypothetical protein